MGGLATAALSWLVLLAAIHAGLRVPSSEALSPLAVLRTLDYSIGEIGAFAALREEFVSDNLGGPAPRPDVTAASESPAAEADGGAPAQVAGGPISPGRPPRTIVEHEFDNDSFGKAHPVETIPFTATTDTSSATRESREHAGCEPLGLSGGTVWYRYTPHADIGLLANTFGTTYPVALAVYAGDSLGNLTQLDCDYNEGGNAQVVFPGKQGIAYHFQASAPTGGGHFEFSLDELGETELVSIRSDGKSGAGEWSSVSANGRYVAFPSQRRTMVDEGDECWGTGTCSDVFVRDMRTGRTERVSVSSDGTPGSDTAGNPGGFPSISGNGRYVAFASGAPNLVQGDTNGADDVFVHDRKTGRTERVSVSSHGEEGRLSPEWQAACGPIYDQPLLDDLSRPDDQRQPLWGEGCWFNNHSLNHGISISSDGRYVVFSSHLQGLVPGVPECTDAGGLDLWNLAVAHPHLPAAVVHGVDAGWLSCRQIYVYDRKTNRTTLASISSDGEPANADSSSPFIARGGRWVVFASDASNLATIMAEDGTERPDTNGFRDAFVHDLRTGTTELVSLGTNEEQGHGASGGAGVRGHVTVSDNGRWVAFVSYAPDLVPGDLNDEVDVFLRDRRTGRTEILTPGAGGSGHASISADGRYIALTYERDEREPRTNAPLAEGHELLVHDRITGTVTRISVATSGEEANGMGSGEPEISADGHFVVFFSDATNLDPRDTDPRLDVYIHELPWTR
jgi:Tol biopolymer transport system component